MLAHVDLNDGFVVCPHTEFAFRQRGTLSNVDPIVEFAADLWQVF
jgi:hypothetical protein